MATNNQTSDSGQHKTALVLAGGGITGAVYELGALRAIDALLIGRTVNDFDLYVGTSAGALVGALIAGGLRPDEILQMMAQRSAARRQIGPRDLFPLNLGDVLHRLRNLPAALYRAGRNLLAQRREVAFTDILWDLAEILPSGFYHTAALDRYVEGLLYEAGRTNDFRCLRRSLFVVATELDTGRRAVFDRQTTPQVSISQAVAASSAVPVLYRPVQIGEHDYVDGGLQGAASLDLAIEAGAHLVVCINPMAPLDTSHIDRNYIRRHGFQAVINQSVRTLLHASVRYHVKNLRAKYPMVDIILIEPRLDDTTIPRYNPMHYASRKAVAEHGFRTVTEGLLANADDFQRILARHGITLQTPCAAAELAPPETPTLLAAFAELETNLRRLQELRPFSDTASG
ncbi:MAG: patatin-like phospholipase family protein [Caldilineaceae bacterium]|nr:patatin-like phospholipase family protein [Caldilineaceae bacterium]